MTLTTDRGDGSGDEPPGPVEPDERSRQPETPSTPRRRSFRERLQWTLWRRWPSRVGYPIPGALRAVHLERDPVENARTTPGADEHISLPYAFIVEIYTPSSVAGLLRGVDRLGFNRDPIRREQLERVTDFVQRTRASGGGGWINLGRMARTAKSSIEPVRSVPLPSIAAEARGGVFTLSGSVSALVILFTLTDAASGSVESVMRADFRTDFRAMSRGLAVASPDGQKSKAAFEARASVHMALRKWIATYFPGAFAGGLVAQPMPIAEVWTTEGVEPFEPQPYWNWMSLLDLDQKYRSWAADDLQDVLMGTGHTGSYTSDGESPPLMFTIPASKAREWDGARSDYIIAMGLSKLVAIHGLDRLLVGYWHRLGSIRDEIGSASSSRHGGSLARLRAIRSRTLGPHMDLRLVAFDAVKFAEDQGYFEHDVPQFVSRWTTDPPHKSDPVSWADIIRGRMLDLSRELRVREEDLRELLASDSALRATIETLEIQKAITLLTRLQAVISVVLLVIAGATLYIAYLAFARGR